jgi:branched-chain amino acid transport system substrate-binding protein
MQIFVCNMHFRHVANIAIFLVVVFVAQMGRPSLATEPYQINAILPLTGQGAFVGTGEAAALRVLEGVVNRQGGIRGTPIKVVVYDDQSTPQVAVQLTNALIAKRAPVIIGSTLVAACLAMMPLLVDGPVAYCLASPVRPPTGSFMFGSGPATSDSFAAMARFIRAHGWRKVAVITSIDASGQEADKEIAAVLELPENRSLTVVTQEHFNITDVTVAAQMSHVRASGAQVLITFSTGTPQGTVLRSFSDAGLDIPVVSSPGNLTYAQMKQYAAFLPSQLYFPGVAAFAFDRLPRGPVKQAVSEFNSALKAAGVLPDIAPLFAWNAGQNVIAALRKYGTGATAKQIREFIADYRANGVLGHEDFRASPQRGIGADAVMVVRWDAQKGTWVGVETGSQ